MACRVMSCRQQLLRHEQCRGFFAGHWALDAFVHHTLHTVGLRYGAGCHSFLKLLPLPSGKYTCVWWASTCCFQLHAMVHHST